jgi:hypothetical protein
MIDDDQALIALLFAHGICQWILHSLTSRRSGVNLWWCCHEPSPGCYSNFNDAYDHCDTKSVTKLDDYYYCCDKSECCYQEDPTCDPGAVCCTDGCSDPSNCTYTQNGCSGTYGQRHNCTWNSADDYCYVPVSD